MVVRGNDPFVVEATVPRPDLYIVSTFCGGVFLGVVWKDSMGRFISQTSDRQRADEPFLDLRDAAKWIYDRTEGN